jgi:hypothetical protein
MRAVSSAARRGARAGLAALALLAAGAAATQGVQRCESPDGKVTYSNTRCPEGTSAVRQVNTAPPISVDDQKSARERARREAAEAGDAAKARDREAAEAERAAAEQKKAQAKARDRCDKAQQALDKARTARAELMQRRAATIEDVQKADREIERREAEAGKACPT